MSEQTAVELFKEWQTGAFLLVGSTVVGFVVGSIGGSAVGFQTAVVGLIGGTLLAFLTFSFLLYGR